MLLRVAFGQPVSFKLDSFWYNVLSMPPYEKNLLEETAKTTQENNRILRKMERALWFSRLFSFIKVIFILGATLGAYYYIQPYIETLLGLYGSGVPDSSSIEKNIRNSLGL